jgi:hypothetical protein
MHELISGSAVPAARVSDLVINDVHGEVLVYDKQCHHIHHLNATAAAIWRLCDGERTVRDLALHASIDEEAVRLALRKCEDARLLDGPLSTEMRGTQSRRTFLRKTAVAGAIALPAIVSISAPTAAQSDSTCVACNTLNFAVVCGLGVSCTNGCCAS